MKKQSKAALQPREDPFKNREFMVQAEKAQPLMVLEYLNSWGNEFLFIFLLIACGFLLLLVNQLSAITPSPETVTTILGTEVPAFWATQFPIFVLIIAAIGLAIYYNMRRRYIENMMYFFYEKAAQHEIKSDKKK